MLKHMPPSTRETCCRSFITSCDSVRHPGILMMTANNSDASRLHCMQIWSLALHGRRTFCMIMQHALTATLCRRSLQS